MRLRLLACASTIAIVVLTDEASAQETTTYEYDALGRFVRSSISGGPNDAIKTVTCFDAADNRSQYLIGIGTSPSCSAPTPTPTPTTTNSPPVAVADSTSFLCSQTKTLNVLANDYDPDGNTPLSLVSVSSTSLWVTIAGTTSVQISSGHPGTFSFSYVVQDSLGATSTGYVTATVAGNQNTCLQDPPPE